MRIINMSGSAGGPEGPDCDFQEQNGSRNPALATSQTPRIRGGEGVERCGPRLSIVMFTAPPQVGDVEPLPATSFRDGELEGQKKTLHQNDMRKGPQTQSRDRRLFPPGAIAPGMACARSPMRWGILSRQAFFLTKEWMTAARTNPIQETSPCRISGWQRLVPDPIFASTPPARPFVKGYWRWGVRPGVCLVVGGCRRPKRDGSTLPNGRSPKTARKNQVWEMATIPLHRWPAKICCVEKRRGSGRVLRGASFFFGGGGRAMYRVQGAHGASSGPNGTLRRLSAPGPYRQCGEEYGVWRSRGDGPRD